jgi:dipeptidyl aminopeptidase/acylaminoacyl peptidase
VLASLVLVAASGLSSLSSPAAAQDAASGRGAAQGRPLTLDDLFRLEEIGRYFGGPVSFSPDGEQLAFVIGRAKSTATHHKREYLWGNDRSDVFLVPAKGGTPKNLTNGLADGAGFWAPVWSPDGARLAMLSTRGGNVRLWVWERATGALTRLTERAVDLTDVRKRPMIWISPTQLLCPVLPEGEQPTGWNIEVRAAEKAQAEWPKTWRGLEPAVSVLQSGVAGDPSKKARGTLLLLDVSSGQSRIVLDSATRELLLSPSGREVAFLRQVDVYRPRADKPLEFGAQGTFEAAVFSLAGERLLAAHALNHDVIPGSLRWSPDGVLAFVSRPESGGGAARVATFTPSSRAVALVGSPRINPQAVVRETPKLLPVAGGAWLVLAARADAEGPAVYARRDWWLAGPGETERLLTADMKKAPAELFPEPGARAFVGIAEGALWRIRADGAAPQNLTASLPAKLSALVWPDVAAGGDTQMPEEGRTYTRVLAGAQQVQGLDVYAIDLATGRSTPLARPAPAATVMGYDPVGRTVLFSLGDNTGTTIWTTRAASAATVATIYQGNTHLRDIAPAITRLIEYRDLDGKPAKGWLYLPPDYREGQRLPLIAWVYPGSVVTRPTPSPYDSINRMSSLNPQIPVARGYAFLKPSMPLKPEGDVDDPMLRLTNGVLPAVDKAIDLGIADPERVYVMGQSFGGFATYGLVTQTTRFKAAVALAGLSDLTSLYGEFGARNRYEDDAHEDLFQQALAESAQVRLGGPPWKEMNRYLRNSPITYVDRVETPLMIIQGDMDYVSIRQGEEFFSALYRQAKRAEFVRYWGEGHVLESPANIRDMWDRIFAWLEQFPSPSSGPSSGPSSRTSSGASPAPSGRPPR